MFRGVPDDAWFSSAGELQIPHFVRDDNPFQVASGVICRDPRGLKPASSLALGGTAEAVPFPFVEMDGSFRSAEALRHPKSSARLSWSAAYETTHGSPRPANCRSLPFGFAQGRDDNPFQVASGVICRGPQGLKLASLLALGGTLRLRSGQALEAMPFPFVEGKHFSGA